MRRCRQSLQPLAILLCTPVSCQLLYSSLLRRLLYTVVFSTTDFRADETTLLPASPAGKGTPEHHNRSTEIATLLGAYYGVSRLAST